MGLLSFIKGVGEKVFGKEAPAVAATPEAEPLRASALLAHVKSLGLAYNSLTVKTPSLKLKKITTAPNLDPVFGDFEVRVG